MCIFCCFFFFLLMLIVTMCVCMLVCHSHIRAMKRRHNGQQHQVSSMNKTGPESKLSRTNKIIDTHAVPVIRCHASIVSWPKEDMDASDVKTWKLLVDCSPMCRESKPPRVWLVSSYSGCHPEHPPVNLQSGTRKLSANYRMCHDMMKALH